MTVCLRIIVVALYMGTFVCLDTQSMYGMVCHMSYVRDCRSCSIIYALWVECVVFSFVPLNLIVWRRTHLPGSTQAFLLIVWN